jgi:GNAT superfamily N-acetyltransferase
VHSAPHPAQIHADLGGPLYPPLPGALRPSVPAHLAQPATMPGHTAHPGSAPRRTVVLRDGSRVLLRPLRSSDREVYLRSFDHLSAASRYMRFFSPKPHLTDRELRYLLDVDHHDHEAIAAIDLSTGAGVGVARYVRDHDTPGLAEVSITVVDDHQGLGLGALLLEFLAARAADEGVTRLRALVLADNTHMLHLIRSRWPHHQLRRAPASVLELEFDVQPA